MSNAQNFTVSSAFTSAAVGNATASGSSDTSSQAAQIQEGQEQTKANQLAAQYGMDQAATLKLVKIADRIAELNGQNAMDAQARMEMTDSALAVVGITNAQVSAAVATYMNKQGDCSGVSKLVAQAAAKLNTSADVVKTQLLPAILGNQANICQ